MDFKPGQLCVISKGNLEDFAFQSEKPSWQHIAISKDNTDEWVGDKMNDGQIGLYLGSAKGHYPADWMSDANGKDCDCLVLIGEKCYFVHPGALKLYTEKTEEVM